MPDWTGADLLVFLLWIAAYAVAVTAPGWAVVGVAARYRRAARGGGPAWPAGVAGALVGALLCWFVVAALTEGLGTVPAVVASWVACWALAWLVVRGHRRAPAPAAASDGGWGR